MSKINEKLIRFRETMTNLNRVGGVGPNAQQSSYMQYVLNAQAELLEEMASILTPTQSVKSAPVTTKATAETKPIAATDESPKGTETVGGAVKGGKK